MSEKPEGNSRPKLGVSLAKSDSPLPPVLITAFNRPENLKSVLDLVASAGPSSVYISIDGPRPGNDADTRLCRQTADVAIEFGRENNLTLLVQRQNLGCRIGVSTAISWFFSHEAEGIILEDDCMPNAYFFQFCRLSLAHFRFDRNVGHISGNNFFPSRSDNKWDVVFSNFAPVWGWATWKDRWSDFENGNRSELESPRIDQWPDDLIPGFKTYWQHLLRRISSRKLDSWAHEWQNALWRHGRIAVLPPRNLVQNIGFSSTSTHTLRKPISRKFHPRAFQIRRVIFPSEIHLARNYDLKVQLLMHPTYGKFVRSMIRLVWVNFYRGRIF